MELRLTWLEMKAQFPNEWLLIVDFETDSFGRLVAGTVRQHSPDMAEIAKPPALPIPTAFRYTGESTFMGLRSHAEHDHTI